MTSEPLALPTAPEAWVIAPTGIDADTASKILALLQEELR